MHGYERRANRPLIRKLIRRRSKNRSSRAVVERRAPKFEGAQIRRATGESIGDGRQCHTGINGR